MDEEVTLTLYVKERRGSDLDQDELDGDSEE